MSYLEQHFVDHCKTADDVRKAAHLVHQKRLDSIPKKRPGPWLFELVRQAEFLPSFLPKPIQKSIVELEFPILPDPPYYQISVRHIHRAVALKFGIDLVDFMSARKTPKICEARFVSWVLCKCLTKLSFPQIGRQTGDRDHTTIMHGCRKFQWLTEKLRAELTQVDPLSTWVNRAHELVVESKL